MHFPYNKRIIPDLSMLYSLFFCFKQRTFLYCILINFRKSAIKHGYALSRGSARRLAAKRSIKCGARLIERVIAHMLVIARGARVTVRKSAAREQRREERGRRRAARENLARRREGREGLARRRVD